MENNRLEDIPIPYKLVLKNFGSHENTEILFGEPNENCFFRGSSGKGKTHIIRAIQCALGNKPNSDNEIFTFKNTKTGKKFRNETERRFVYR